MAELNHNSGAPIVERLKREWMACGRVPVATGPLRTFSMQVPVQNLAYYDAPNETFTIEQPNVLRCECVLCMTTCP